MTRLQNLLAWTIGGQQTNLSINLSSGHCIPNYNALLSYFKSSKFETTGNVYTSICIVWVSFIWSSWYVITIQEGHLSSNGECFDIGMCTRKALHQFESSNQTEPYCGGTSERASGNGSLMRLCPVPIFYHKHPTVAIQLSKESSRVTHGSPAALEACQ